MDHDLDRENPVVSILLPCLDEAESVADTVSEAFAGLSNAGVSGEVIVVDNGSHDGSPELARDAGARVVHESVPGYGAALRRGIAEANGQIGVMADADLTYDLSNVEVLLAQIEAGSDLVIASRLEGVNRGTMPLAHRLIGTPVISFVLRRVTRSGVRVRDSQSGYRAFRLARIRDLQLQTSGMEFASEMLLRAGESGCSIAEVRLPYRARVGESKLNPVADGVRHLKLLALLAPRIALLWPGTAAGVLGLILTMASLFQPDGLTLGEARWQPVFFAPILLVVASLLVVSYLIMGVASPLLGESRVTSPRVMRFRLANIGAALMTTGVALNGVLFVRWISGADAWSRSLALAGMAQGLTLSGAVWVMSAFLYWLLQRQSEYRAHAPQ
ncbi:MAG: glycosyltransferase family 2 protein [Actinobacteria bacterium]|nr:glycosyltransferase family 2 protein [Actinomycetota bacterium]